MKHLSRLIIIISFVIAAGQGVIASDLAIGTIVLPQDTMGLGCEFNPQFWVKNIGLDTAKLVHGRMSFYDLDGVLYYYGDEVVVNIPPSDSSLCTGPPYTATSTGLWRFLARVSDSNDVNQANDTASKYFYVIGPYDAWTNLIQFDNILASSDSSGTMGMIQWSPDQQWTGGFGFLNILARRTDSSPPYWILRNLRCTPSNNWYGDRIGMFIDFRRMGVKPGELVPYLQVWQSFTDTPLTIPPIQILSCLYDQVEHENFAVAPNNAEDPAARHPAPMFVDSMPMFSSLYTITDTVHRDTLVPNNDLDSAQHYQVPAGFAGDWNADGSATIANGMEWLEGAHPKTIRTGLSRRDELWDISAISERASNGPLSFREFLNARLAFIDSFKIPVRVKFQSVWNEAQDILSPNPKYNHAAQYAGGPGAQLAATRTPQWDWVVQALRDSEDVAMYIGWWDSTGVRRGGHYVNVTETVAFSGTRQIRFIDDSRQDTSGGTEAPSAYWSVSREGYPRLLDMSWPNRMCFVEAVVASSLDTSVKFNATGVAEKLTADGFSLTIYHNPTRVDESVTADLFIATAGRYRISIFDITGREVALLGDGDIPFGASHCVWNGVTAGGGRAPGGVYIMSVVGAGHHASAVILRF